MRILVIDDDRPEVDFVWRCQTAGHDVKWYVRKNELKALVGKGLVTRVPEYRPWLHWADLIVLTANTIYVKDLDDFRRQNPTKPIIAATKASAEWELNRTLGMQVFKKAGIAIPEYQEFSDYDRAIAYVKRENRAFVSKPCGDEPDKSLSYVAKSPADLVYMLERWKKAKKHQGSFILQEKVEGCEMAVGGWFASGGFDAGWFENWEFKKLMAGDLGVATGEQGTVCRYVKKSKLADMVLKPLEAALERTGHTGYVDVNCIIDAHGKPWPLEFTTRFGYPTLNIQRLLHQGDEAEWLRSLASGEITSHFLLNKIAVGVVLSIPDYPYSHLTAKEVTGIPIYGITPKVLEHISPLEVMVAEAPQDVGGEVVTTPCWATAGDYVLVATGVGETVRQARTQAYRILKRIRIPNSPSYRVDIGVRLRTQLQDLQQHGFALSMEY
jgi:phosphoribosylamine---glycine ligase